MALSREAILAEIQRRQALAQTNVQSVPERTAIQALNARGSEGIPSAEPRTEGHVYGVPIANYMDSAPVEQRDQTSLRSALQARLAINNRPAPEPEPVAAPARPQNEWLVNSPLETGEYTVDHPEARTYGKGNRNSLIGEFTVPERVINPESPEGRRLAAAKRGVDFRRGAPFMVRLSQAWSLPNEEARVRAASSFIQEMANDRPSDVPVFEYDQDLGELIFYRKITEEDVAKGRESQDSLGKYRPTSMDEAGFSFADFADMMDPAEIGSLVGSMAATAGPGKLTFWKAGTRSGAGGAIGRDLGVFLQAIKSSVVDDYADGSELIYAMSTGAGQELVAGWLGEFGYRAARRVAGMPPLDYAAGSNLKDDTAARETAKRFADTQERISEVTGRPYRVSEGEAAQDSHLIQREAADRKQASSRFKMSEEERFVENMEDRNLFAQRALRGDVDVIGTRSSGLQEIKTAVREGGTMQMVVTRNSKDPRKIDVITFGPKVNASKPYDPSKNNGVMYVKPSGDKTWRVSVVGDFEDLKGTGLGGDTYVAAARAAREHGVNFVSDTWIQGPAVKGWMKIAREVGPVKENPLQLMVKGQDFPRDFDNWTEAQRWMKNNDIPLEDVALYSGAEENAKPIFELPRYEGVALDLLQNKPSKELIEEAVQTSLLGADGKPLGEQVVRREIVHDPIDVFRRMSGNSTQLAAVAEDLNGNQYLKARFMNELFFRFEEGILDKKTGEFSMKAYKKWMEESKAMFNKILTPEEFTRLYNFDRPAAPQAFRSLVESMNKSVMAAAKPLSKILNVEEGDMLNMLSDNDKIFDTLRKVYRQDPKTWKRVAGILQSKGNQGQWRRLQEMVKEDIYLMLRDANAPNPTRKAVVKLGDKLLKDDNFNFLLDMVGDPTYVNDVKHFIRSLQSSAYRSGIKGIGAEQAPPKIGFIKTLLFKDVFGRRQRAFTAGRKYGIQKLADTAIRIVSDPDLLRGMTELENASVMGPRAAQFLARAGILQLYGVTNIHDKQAMEDFANQLQADMAEFMEEDEE